MEEEKTPISPSRLEYFLERLAEEELAELRLEIGGKPKKREEVLVKLMELLMAGTTADEALYAELYPGKAFSYKQVRNLRSELFARVIDYLAMKRFLGSKEKPLYLAKMMNQKQALRFYPTLIEQQFGDLQKEPQGLEEADLQNRLRLEYLKYEVGKSGRLGQSVSGLIRGTEEAWVARMLYFGIVHHERQGQAQRLPPEPSAALWPAVLAALRTGEWGDSKLVQMYYTLFLLVTEREDKYWPRVKAFLSTLNPEPGDEDAEQLYTIALNHLIRKRNAGDDSQLAEIFHLYKEMLGHQLVRLNLHHGAWHFKAISACAINLGEYEWARKFIAVGGAQLPEAFRENMVNYAMGRLEFSEGKWEEAEKRMNSILQDYSDPYLGLDARGYLMRIYYETGNITGLDALTNSFRLFLRRHRHLSAERLKNYHEFIRFFRRFIALPAGRSGRSAKLLEEIRQSRHDAGKNWFIQKLESLE